MGVLNVTPDSFSDGGRFTRKTLLDVSAVVDAAAAMIQAGADWLDVGGESTRPGAAIVSEQEELERVIPVVDALASRFETAISVDTSSPALISQVSSIGAHMINDVRALTRPGALEAFVKTDMCLCLMHMQGDPGSMQSNPCYSAVVSEVKGFLKARMDAVMEKGVPADRICLDPGFGFGKTLSHNLHLLHGVAELTDLGRPILVGFSRKSMIETITGRPVDERLAGTICLNTLALQAGATILRVHDVPEAIDTVKIWKSYWNVGKGQLN